MGEWPEATHGALLQAYSPRDPLAEFGQGDLSLNDLRIMIHTLPPDSAMHRANPRSRGFTTRDEFVMHSANSLRTLESMVASLGGQDWPTSHFMTPAEGFKQQAEQEMAMVEARSWWSGVEAAIPGGVVSRG